MQQVDSVRQLTELTGLETVSLMHAGAAAATEGSNLAIISFWKKRKGSPEGRVDNLGGPRADQLQTEWAVNTSVLQKQDIYYAFNSMAWFRDTKLGANKLTGWREWKRRSNTTRYLNAVAVDLDFHQGDPPSFEQMLTLLDRHLKQAGIPEPNILQFSGRGLWAFWLLAAENGNPGIRAWPLQLDLWMNLQRALVRCFSDLADQKITDPARLTRVPGSWNSKSDTVVRAFLLHPQRYTIGKLSAVLKVESRRAASRKSRARPNKSPRHQAAGRARVARLLEGLDQIHQHCWGGHLTLGHRHDFLWVYARALRMNRYSRQAITEALQTLAAAATPPVGLSEVKRLISSACKAIDWHRAFSYKGLFAKFGIAPELSDRVTAWIRPQVDRDTRRAQLKQKSLAKQAELDHRVAQLRLGGLTGVEIAAQLDCSARLVASSFKRLHMIRSAVPPDVQSSYLLIGSKAKRPNALASEKFAQIGTPTQQRRRRLLLELDLIHAPVRDAMKTLQACGIRAGRGTVWRDQQFLRLNHGQHLTGTSNLSLVSENTIQNNEGDQHAQSDGKEATRTLSGIGQVRDQILESVARQSPRSAGLLDGTSTGKRPHP